MAQASIAIQAASRTALPLCVHASVASMQFVHSQPVQLASFASPMHAVCCGVTLSLQVASQPAVPSQASEPSFTPLPQRAGQSLSVLALAPGGQQPSLFNGVVIGVCVHAALQFSALPVSTSVVHASLSWQSAALGQRVLALAFSAISQVSPLLACTMPSPHFAEQSESLAVLHCAGQHLSPELQPTGVNVHCRSQAVPTSVACRHGSGDVHVIGQAPGVPVRMPRSQRSLSSICPSPQRGASGAGAATPAAETTTALPPPPPPPTLSIGSTLTRLLVGTREPS
jgi:hypothetical protein